VSGDLAGSSDLDVADTGLGEQGGYRDREPAVPAHDNGAVGEARPGPVEILAAAERPEA
jgi:hypothetical protein